MIYNVVLIEKRIKRQVHILFLCVVNHDSARRVTLQKASPVSSLTLSHRRVIAGKFVALFDNQ